MTGVQSIGAGRYLAGTLLALLALASPASVHAVWSPELVARAIENLIPGSPMVDIARCESGLRQYDASGAALRGGLGQGMIGVFQLHEAYHRRAAALRGYNIDTLLGNIGYARELYRNEGTVPWRSSRHCWSASVGEAEPARGLLAKDLRYGMLDGEVVLLKRALAAGGHPILGASGRTDLFDVPTVLALMRFQCARGIACSHTESGEYARVGPRTRSMLNSVR